MATSWTKRPKSGAIAGEGFLTGAGFMNQGFLSGSAGTWTKRNKVADTWTKRTKVVGA